MDKAQEYLDLIKRVSTYLDDEIRLHRDAEDECEDEDGEEAFVHNAEWRALKKVLDIIDQHFLAQIPAEEEIKF